ncbi:hypothetical protein [uncultured Sphingomonas sp.]|uniref:hypothetical protein n=1 Tax=uncultured Sphingomonas sp. TaxID=158754 RepID=UPI0035CC11D5
MVRLSVMLAASALVAAAPAADRMTPDEAAAVQRALDRGALLYAYDQAAWHGTDDFLAKAPDTIRRSGGWIVDGPADAPTLVFFDKDDPPKTIYVARFSGGKLVQAHLPSATEDRTLSPLRLRMVAALRSARAAFGHAPGVFACANKPFNTVVLPPERPDGPILVYFLTPQTRAGEYPLGGHYLIEVDASGAVGVPRAFTKSCLPIAPDATKGRPSAMLVSHLLDPTPTEIHVFSSLVARLPVYVATQGGKRLWSVAGSTIRLVDAKPKAATPPAS